MRFLEDYGKFNKFKKIRMYSFSERTTFYESCGYRKTGATLELEDGKFEEMEISITW